MSWYNDTTIVIIQLVYENALRLIKCTLLGYPFVINMTWASRVSSVKKQTVIEKNKTIQCYLQTWSQEMFYFI
jgi:hypothetical protein